VTVRLPRREEHGSSRDPMQHIDLLLLEHLLPGEEPPRGRGERVLEAASILLALLCLFTFLITVAGTGTTVVVAAPPAQAGLGAPAPQP
jgi:hypothetical protein